MVLYDIPFQGRHIIYRPLRMLAFIGNRGLVRYIRARAAHGDEPHGIPSHSTPSHDDGPHGDRPRDDEIEAFLESMAFWEPDPPAPEPWDGDGCPRRTMAVLLMTNECNLRCVYCYAHGGEGDRREMSVPVARRVVDTAFGNARDAGAARFSLSFHGGGEPTMNWDVMTSAVERAIEKPLACDVSMATNGVWTDEQRRYVVDRFTGISLSLDGPKPVQDAQRPRADGRGSFECVMESVRALEEAGTPYGIRMTVTDESVSRLGESVAFLCEETRSGPIQVEPCYTSARGEHGDPTPEQGRAFVEGFMDGFRAAAAAGRELTYSGARPGTMTAVFCRAPYEAMVVTPDGDLVTCFEIYDRRHPLSSTCAIGRASADELVVDDEAVRSFRARQEARRERCVSCFCHWHCGGDCETRAGGQESTRRARCQVNRAVTRELLAWRCAEGDGVWLGDVRVPCGEHAARGGCR